MILCPDGITNETDGNILPFKFARNSKLEYRKYFEQIMSTICLKNLHPDTQQVPFVVKYFIFLNSFLIKYVQALLVLRNVYLTIICI